MNATEFYKKWDSNIEKSSTQKMNMFADDMDDLLDDAPVDSDFNWSHRFRRCWYKCALFCMYE